MLKEQNVIIANMTKETLQDILPKLLVGLEPPLSLSEVPETKIVEGMTRTSHAIMVMVRTESLLGTLPLLKCCLQR